MTSTFTANLNLQLQGVGDNSGSWGTTLNNSVFANIDQALGGSFSVSVAGSTDYTLSATNALNIEHILTGVLTGSINYIFPASAGRIVSVKNSTTGAFTVTVKQSGGTGYVVPQGETVFLKLSANTTTATPAFTNLGNSPSIGAPSGTTGALRLFNATNTNVTTIQAGTVGTNVTWTLPVADGTSGQYLQTNGTGALSFTTPASATAAMTLISTQTISSSTATLSVTSGIDSTYTHYIWEISNLTSVSNNVGARITVQQGGSFVAGTSYNSQGFYISTGSALTAFSNNGTAFFDVAAGLNGVYSTGAPSTIRFEFWNPSVASALNVMFEMTEGNNGPPSIYTKSGGFVNTSAATTGLKLIMSNGNILSCTAKLYGMS